MENWSEFEIHSSTSGDLEAEHEIWIEDEAEAEDSVLVQLARDRFAVVVDRLYGIDNHREIRMEDTKDDRYG
jgi:hypothetical protein